MAHRVLGPLGRCWGLRVALLGALGARLARSWGFLGRFGAPLGVLIGFLDDCWSILDGFLFDFGWIFNDFSYYIRSLA